MTSNHYQLIYLSAASFRFTRENLTKLLVQSRKSNMEHEVTGLLLYAEGHFMQLLEGPRESVEELMVRIKNDPRHHHVDVLEKGPVAQRHFPDWSMAFLDFASLEVRAMAGYSTFLEGPLSAGKLGASSDGRAEVLHYFKAVMTASNGSLLHLSQSIEQRKTGGPGNIHSN